MIRPWVALLFGALVLQACGSDIGPPLEVSNVTIYAPLPGRTVTVAYMDIENRSGKPITINGVRSTAFGRAELHETTIADGIASMQPLAAVVIEARSQLKFAPGGTHIMLIDPVKALLPGGRIQLEIRYDSESSLLIDAEVRTRLDDNG